MSIVKVEKNSYTVEPLYQWDINQVLTIYGLSLPSIPEIHFTNDAMERAIVRNATMDSAGVITVEIPNSLLQKPYKIKAYVCIYEGDTFKSEYKLEIPIRGRARPGDYTIEDSDEEIYSFNALENLFRSRLVTSEEASAIAKKAETAQTVATAAETRVTKLASETEENAIKAQTAKTAAESALSNIQTALDSLPEGDILVINDLTTGGTSAALSAEMGKDLKEMAEKSNLGSFANNYDTLVDEMVSVARSYYEKDAAYHNETGSYYFGYDQGYTCFASDFGEVEGNYLDCSAFVGLILRGVPFSKSPYALPYASRKDWDEDSVLANTDEYCWAVNPFEWEMPHTVLPDSTKNRVRTAAQLCQWLMSMGCGIPYASDFSNVEPGDIVFYGVSNGGVYTQPDRLWHISHVALCATKETVTETDTDFAGYSFKHQIYDSVDVDKDGKHTFNYTVDASGNIVSNRWLETTLTKHIVAICRPSFLANKYGRVKQIKEGGTGATNAIGALANMGAAPQRNIADNTNFLDPVNQRGQTEYSGTGYTIDRWQVRRSNSITTLDCSTVVGDNGVTLKNNSTGGSVFFTQFFENPLPPGDYTLSALVTALSGSARIALYNAGGSVVAQETITESGVVSLTKSITATDAVTSIRIVIPTKTMVTLSAVKLERSRVQTLARLEGDDWVINNVPDYALELWKCQRYYQLFSSEDKRPTSLMDYRPVMMKDPTLGTIEIDGVTYYSAEANPS